MAGMTEAMVKETQTLLKLSGVDSVSSVYFGGGTPSLADVSTIEKIMTTISCHVKLDGSAEVTLEVNPTALETNKLQ